jgi:hypothetical protein
MEYRDLGLLKLFFAELGGPEQVEALALQQAEAQRRQLAEYEAIQERFAGRPELAHRLRSLDLGTRMARAAPSSGRTWLRNRMGRTTGAWSVIVPPAFR